MKVFFTAKRFIKFVLVTQSCALSYKKKRASSEYTASHLLIFEMEIRYMFCDERMPFMQMFLRPAIIRWRHLDES